MQIRICRFFFLGGGWFVFSHFVLFCVYLCECWRHFNGEQKLFIYKCERPMSWDREFQAAGPHINVISCFLAGSCAIVILWVHIDIVEAPAKAASACLLWVMDRVIQ